MKRAITGLLGALMVSGTLLASVAAPRPAQADFFHRRRVENRRWSHNYYGNRRHDWDRDGIRNRRDWDDDNDGIPDWRDRNDRRYNSRYWNSGRYWGNGYYYGTRRGDRDGDGIPNRRDHHPDNPYRR